MQHIGINIEEDLPATRDLPQGATVPDSLPSPKEVKLHPSQPNGGENASIYFIGTATTIVEWMGVRIMTDPNFLHAGDHVHLGPGVSATRQTNPAVDLHNLPRIDLVLLSHYHGDHFDQEVEASLRRDLPIITTPHAHKQLTERSAEPFTSVTALDHFESAAVNISSKVSQGRHQIRVTGMPGKHVPSHPIVDTLNLVVQAIPPTNGWMVELGGVDPGDVEKFTCGYRIYITGDTLMVDELKRIPELYRDERIDLMLAHLGGTTVPSPSLAPLALMVTMDAKQGVQLIQLIQPDLTIPIHYDDYNVFASPLKDFKTEVEMAGLRDKIVYLNRGDKFEFAVRGT